LRRRRYSRPGGGTEAPVDDLIDLAHRGVSLAVVEMCCRMGIDSGSFSRAAANLDRVGQLKLSDETLRRLVESEGAAVIRWQEDEQLELDFEAASWRTTATEDGRPVSRVYVGLDGFMLPMITDEEVGKRFEKAKARRKRLGRRPGERRRRLVRGRGSDQRYKEFKLLTLYDQDQRHKLMRATRHGPQRAGKLLRGMAEDVRLGGAEQLVVVADGAEWIAGVIERDLPRRGRTVILDFYHAAEHVHAARRVVFGEQSEAGGQWASGLIEGMLHRRFDSWWEQLVQIRARVRSPAKRRALDKLMGYLLPRREKIDYARFRALGLKIGSGPTESGCKSLSRRLKGVGMRWRGRNAQAMLGLESLHQSNLWKTFWHSRLKSAA
jgi:hypothetical protein